MFGHLLHNDEGIKNIIEGKLERKRKRGRPRIPFSLQIKQKAKVSGYREVKEL